jgi:hypothetical protein
MADIVRAFELPLQVLEWDRSNRKTKPEGWDGWKLLRQCWEQARWLANWTVQQLQLADAGQLKLGDGYVYTHGFTQGNYPQVTFWTGATGSAADVIATVQRKYQEERREVKALRRIHSSHRCYPFPVRGQEWKEAGFDQAGKPWIRVNLPGGRVILRLRGGPEFGRQLALFREVVEGKRPRKQVQIREVQKAGDDHRPGKGSRVMVKMVAELEAREKPGERCLVLTTDPQAFWIAELDQRQAWVLNADHLRGFTVGHARHLARLQRLSEDGKAERRLRSGRVKGIAGRVEKLARKHAHQMASLTHEAAAHVVEFAARNRCGEIFYLDRDRGFIPKFPWAELHGKLTAKCQATGITLHSESGAGVVARPPVEDNNEVFTSEEDGRWLRVVKLQALAHQRFQASKGRKDSHPKVTKSSTVRATLPAMPSSRPSGRSAEKLAPRKPTRDSAASARVARCSKPE